MTKNRILTLYDSNAIEPSDMRIVIIGFTGFNYDNQFKSILDRFGLTWELENNPQLVKINRDYFSTKTHGPRTDYDMIERKADENGDIQQTSPFLRVSLGAPKDLGFKTGAALELAYSNNFTRFREYINPNPEYVQAFENNLEMEQIAKQG